MSDHEDRRGMDGKPTPTRDRCPANAKQDIGINARCWGPRNHPSQHWTFYAGTHECWPGDET